MSSILKARNCTTIPLPLAIGKKEALGDIKPGVQPETNCTASEAISCDHVLRPTTRGSPHDTQKEATTKAAAEIKKCQGLLLKAYKRSLRTPIPLVRINPLIRDSKHHPDSPSKKSTFPNYHTPESTLTVSLRATMCRRIVPQTMMVCCHVVKGPESTVAWPADCNNCGKIKNTKFLSLTLDPRPCENCMKNDHWQLDTKGKWVQVMVLDSD
ncbi:hypothetical protein PT974_07354 [Cladobotryum mycophilum]|uniref:Uncharacterized protein n=1 Tax=Cladobotryum mycophilum TaxID=491253 RepID=A0ABR0SQ69_9HYPO